MIKYISSKLVYSSLFEKDKWFLHDLFYFSYHYIVYLLPNSRAFTHCSLYDYSRVTIRPVFERIASFFSIASHCTGKLFWWDAFCPVFLWFVERHFCLFDYLLSFESSFWIFRGNFTWTTFFIVPFFIFKISSPTLYGSDYKTIILYIITNTGYIM